MSKVYVILGAKGQTGRLIAAQLLEEGDVAEVRCVVRDPALIEAGTFPENKKIKVMKGDVSLEDEKLKASIQGAHCVFFACSAKGYYPAKHVDWKGVQISAKVSKDAGVDRMVLISSQLTHPANRWNLIRGILNTVVTGLFHKFGLMDFKFEGEKALIRSGVNYSIVRPGQLTDGPGGKSKFHAGQCNGSFLSGGSCSREDLAAICIAASKSSSAANCTFEVACTPVENMSEEKSVPEESLFSGLATDFDKGWEKDGLYEDEEGLMVRH
jgi:uncharacterized protein YbjT (DUF2867 family)